MFHDYFVGNPQGIGFHAPDTDHLNCIWEPSPATSRSTARSCDVHRGRRDRPPRCTAGGPSSPGRRWRPATWCSPLDPGALRAWSPRPREPAEPSPAARAGRRPRRGPAVAVTRLWLDRDVAPERPAFNAVSRSPRSTGHRLLPAGAACAEWAARTGGSVVELHSYACSAPDADTATARMRAELAALWPETAGAPVVHWRAVRGHRADFPPGIAGTMPTVGGAAPGTGSPATSLPPRSSPA